jgi:alpha-beta hydrolase superfamily lysophospholipase
MSDFYNGRAISMKGFRTTALLVYPRAMGAIAGILKTLLVAAALLLLAVFIVRAWQAMRGPPLDLWHTHVPDEPDPAAIARMDWGRWLAREDKIFAAVAREVTAKLPPAARIAQNRYFDGAPMHPPKLARDWNRSFTLQPVGPPRGAVVLLHGLTDSPYSLRHFAFFYQQRGFHVVAIRMPGHGTVPGGLTAATVAQWQEATRLAVREARRRAGPGAPLHLVGYSNGAALAVLHALDALDDPTLGVPDRLVLVSPMLGLTPFARFTGLAALPAFVPAFVRAAWLDTITEYNPFKYNSFPVKGGVEAHRLTVLVADEMAAAEAAGRMAKFPPVLALQSVVDTTVSTPAVMSGLFDRLPANGSELVFVDVNRAAYVGPLLRDSALEALQPLLPTAPRRFATSALVNAAPGDPAVVLRRFPAGGGPETVNPLGLDYPRDLFSLGHIALPFPPGDGLYGRTPDPADDQGVALGALAVRGEGGTLSVGMGMLTRVSSNPFLGWFLAQVEATLPPPAAPPERPQ